MADVLQFSMTTITIQGADRALEAGVWLNKNKINYEIAMEPYILSVPIYHFRFFNPGDASHFALRWR
jgi:hypothetical protein